MLESGKRYPSIEMLVRIAIALGVRPGAMLDYIAELYIKDAAHSPEKKGS